MRKVSLLDLIEKKVGGHDKLVFLLVILFIGLIAVCIIFLSALPLFGFPESGM